MNNEDNRDVLERIWTVPRFLGANFIVAVVLGLGLNIVGTRPLTGDVFGVFVSTPTVWFFVVSLIWGVLVATFVQAMFKKSGLRERLPIVTGVGSWLVSLVLGWLVFVGMVNLYVFVN